MTHTRHRRLLGKAVLRFWLVLVSIAILEGVMMRGCTHGRHRTELLSLALQCMRLIDAAIKAVHEKHERNWWPVDKVNPYRFELDTYAKHYAIRDEFGPDVSEAQVIKKLKAMKASKAIEVLHSVQKSALWNSDREYIPPPPGIYKLLAKSVVLVVIGIWRGL